MAGQASYIGGESSLWKERPHCLVVAVIQDVTAVEVPEKGYRYYTATLLLKASLAGEIDPSLHPSIPIRFVANMAGSSNYAVPASGSMVLAFVALHRPPDNENWIESAVIGIMPGRDGSGLAVIKGLDDPKVDATLKLLQEARAEAARTEHSSPTTKPTVP